MKMLVIAVQFSRGGAGPVDEDVGQPASAWRPKAAVADSTGWPGVPEGSRPAIEEVPMALPQNGTEDESVDPVVTRASSSSRSERHASASTGSGFHRLEHSSSLVRSGTP